MSVLSDLISNPGWAQPQQAPSRQALYALSDAIRANAAPLPAPAPARPPSHSGGGGGLFDALANAYGNIAGGIGHGAINTLDWLGHAGTAAASQGERLGGRYLTPPSVTKRLGNAPPSPRQWWQQTNRASQQISGNQLVGKPVPEGKVPVLSDIISHLPGGSLTSGIAQHPGAGANQVLARGAELATNPLTYVAPGGVAAHGTEAVAGHIADAASEAIARETGQTAADWIAGTAQAATPEQQAAVDAIQSQAKDIINTARRGGVSALTKDQIGTVNEWAGNTLLKKGVGLRLPGGNYLPLTTGEGPLAAASVGRHELQSALARAVLGSGEAGSGTAGALGRALGQEGSGPTKLGEAFGSGNSVSKAIIRGGGDAGGLESIIGRLNVTKNLEHVGIADQVFSDLKRAAKGKDLNTLLDHFGGDHAALMDHLLTGLDNPSYGASRITPEIHQQIADQLANAPDFAPRDVKAAMRGYAESAGYHVANQNAAAAAAAGGYGIPSELSPQAAQQAGLAHQGQQVAEAQNAAVAASDQAQAAHEAASTERATQSPKLIAQAEQASGGTPQAASYSPAAGAASPSATAPVPSSPPPVSSAPGATQEGSQALGLQGLDQAPTAASQPGTVGPGPSRLEQALAAAQSSSDPSVHQAALDALNNELSAVKETLANSPSPGKMLTPDKVKIWAHARNLGIDTNQSLPRIVQSLKDAAAQGEAAQAAASPALDSARAVEATQQAATHSTVDESHAALDAHAQQLQEKGVPNTPAGDAVVKANSQIDEANLRAKDPAYEAQRTQELQQQLHTEAQAGSTDAAAQLHESQQWEHAAATSSDPVVQEAARLNQVAIDAGHAADQAAGRVKFQADTFNKMLADRSGAAERVGQQIYKNAHDFAAHSIITPGIATPNDVAAILQRVAEETAQPNAFVRRLDSIVRGYKTGALATPGFQSRLVLGHAFMNLLARVSPTSYVALARDLSNDGARYADDPALLEKWQRLKGLGNMGQFRAESGLGETGTLAEKAGNAFQRVNPLSSKGPLAKLSMRGAEGIQSYFRMALGHDVMFRQGRSLEEAAAAITRFHFNYSDASKADSVMKRIIPFYTFLRNNVPLQIQMAVENPKVVGYYLKANSAIQKSGNPLIPGLALGAVASPLTSAGKLIGSPMDGSAGVQKELYGRVTPLITGPLEFAQMSQYKDNAPTKPLFGSGNTWTSGKNIFTGDLHLPSWAVSMGKAAGLVHTEPKTGKTFVSAISARLITKFLPVLAHARQLTSNEPTYANNRGATILRLVAGIDSPPPTPTPQQQASFAKSKAYNDKQQAQADAYDMGVPYPKFTRNTDRYGPSRYSRR